MTSNQEAERVIVSSAAAQAYVDLEAATNARAQWEAEEKRLKALILAELYGEEGDEKPWPIVATDMAGHELFKVTIGTWRGLDQKYLKAKYPQTYAESETSKPTRTIRPA